MQKEINSVGWEQRLGRLLCWLREPVAPKAEIAGVRSVIRSRDFRRWRKAAEYFLWLVALGTLGYCTAQYSAAAIHQSRQSARLDSMRAQAAAQIDETDGAASRMNSNIGAPPLGRIEIPSVGVSAIVEDGESDSTLAESVGHIRGTALPGERGNAALAAHRDTYFRDLADIQKGDEVYFTTANAIFKYRVDDIQIVDPTDVSALAPSTDSRLTLITCYPFHYIGPAPKRFVVVASLEDNAPQSHVGTGNPPIEK
jgi:sortase A